MLSFHKIICLALGIMAVLPCCSQKQNSSLEWCTVYSADSLYSVDIPQGYSDLEALDMSSKYTTYVTYNSGEYENMIFISIWQNKNDNLKDYAESLHQMEINLETQLDSTDHYRNLQLKAIQTEDSLVVFRSIDKKQHFYYLLKKSGAHIYLISIMSDFDTKKTWNTSMAQKIANSIHDHTREVLFSYLTADKKEGKWILQKSGFSVDTSYEFQFFSKRLAEIIEDYRSLGSERINSRMPRGCFAFESKDKKCVFFVDAFELPFGMADSAEIEKYKETLQNNGSTFIEQKINDCIVIKEVNGIITADDGKLLECFTVFKGKRIWSFGLFRDPILPQMTDKVLQKMEFWE